MHGGMKTYTGSAAAARNYVEADRGRADDYYLAEGTGVAERHVASPTSGVRRAEPLTGDAYEAWVAGVDLDTGVPKGRLRNDDKAVRFVEVVVNGPKSWSLAAELHPAIGAAYDAAQDRAAMQIIDWLAEHATTRVGPRGAQVQVPVQQIEAVTVRHYTSRAGDPHRHLHLQINARVFAESAWRGLHTVGVRDCLDAINGIGHAAVACDPEFRVTLAEHGFVLNADGEIVQLADYVGPFSARAAQIGRNIDRYETDWREANPGHEPGPVLRSGWDARAWAEGRPDKVIPQSGDALRQRWLEELHALGYCDPGVRVQLTARHTGEMDRDRSVAIVLSRLAARRSGWNAADVRGEVEQLIARAGVVAEASVRTELAEDLTARTLGHCVPLLARTGVPEHVRGLTSRHVLDVETDLVSRFAARAKAPRIRAQLRSTEPIDGLDAAQRAVVDALAGACQLVVVEGAAGAGKTTTLAAVRAALQERGQGLTVVTPTLKAAKIAADQVGTRAGSAAWIAHQHGYRWDEHGAWTRLRPGDDDPHTGTRYDGPRGEATLRRGDLLLVDEAGMLDQDTARALLTIADEHGVRMALVGDRHQLSAVGRGGVLGLAACWADPDACLTLDTVHRFTRDITDVDGKTVTVADTEYAELTLAMRTGENPADVFDALLARGQIRVHGSDAKRQAALADAAATAIAAGAVAAVVADTRDRVAQLNAAIRERLVTVGRVDDQHATTTSAGQRVGVGDRVATRRNDRDLDIANRDVWTVTGINEDGGLVVTSEQGQRKLPSEYVHRHVEHAYASTVHGVQGDTAATAHLVLGEHTGAASAYVGMTRGRATNVAHLVAGNLDEARDDWIAVFARDRADLGPAHAVEQAEREASHYAQHRPFEKVLAELRDAWSVEQKLSDRLAHDEDRFGMLREIVALRDSRDRELPPLENTYRHARHTAHHAQQQADAAQTVLARETDRIRDSLLQTWDARRDSARGHAQTVHDGTGRLGRHRAAVAHARQELTVWADTWRGHVPDLPTDTGRLADRLLWFENRPELWEALHRTGIRDAERAHPDAVAAMADAKTAADVSRTAWQSYRDSLNYYNHALSSFGNLGHTDDPARRLSDLEDNVAATTHQLQSVQNDVAQLMRDPVVRAQPSTRLDLERARWRHDHDTAQRAISVDVPSSGLDHRHDEQIAWQVDTREHERGISR